MKLIMENWRRFLFEQKIRDSFYYTNYEKNPLTDEEVQFVLNPETEEDKIAREEINQHMEDANVFPVQLMRMKPMFLGLRVKDKKSRSFSKVKRLKPPKKPDPFGYGYTGADGTSQAVPVKTSQYSPSENIKNGTKLVWHDETLGFGTVFCDKKQLRLETLKYIETLGSNLEVYFKNP